MHQFWFLFVGLFHQTFSWLSSFNFYKKTFFDEHRIKYTFCRKYPSNVHPEGGITPLAYAYVDANIFGAPEWLSVFFRVFSMVHLCLFVSHGVDSSRKFKLLLLMILDVGITKKGIRFLNRSVTITASVVCLLLFNFSLAMVNLENPYIIILAKQVCLLNLFALQCQFQRRLLLSMAQTKQF